MGAVSRGSRPAVERLAGIAYFTGTTSNTMIKSRARTKLVISENNMLAGGMWKKLSACLPDAVNVFIKHLLTDKSSRML
jgi:hypothetical protein